MRLPSALVLLALLAPASRAQDLPERGIRRTIPMTNAIQRAFDAGTRDATGKPGPNYWQLETDFEIEASLNPATQVISGSQRITIRNNSPSPLDRIVVRLDHNIFRDDVPRGFSVPAEETDGMVVTRMVLDGRTVDLHARPPVRRFDQPPTPWFGVSGLRTTVATLSLDAPIPPNSTATLEIDWHTKLPGGPTGQGHRMTQRWEDRLFQPTQWFPRLAKYDDLRGWDTNPYLGPSEFYNNFGRFDVKIDVPGGWIVSGTGVLQNPDEVLTATARERLARVTASDEEIMIVAEGEPKTAPGNSLTWHFTADKVNDFAWATSRDFLWRATRATIPTKGPVPVHMVYLPERAPFFAEAGTRTRHALEFYSALWAPYPFPQLTLQDGPSAGMEYPMVINSNQGAADHETAHQWWPMMVGTNETWYGWMDEGFNTYMNILSGADSRGEPAVLDGQGLMYGMISGDEWEPPMMWNANFGGPMYGFQTYQKAPLMLSMLGGIYGDEAVQKVMSDYTHAWSFKHPSPWDYAHFMQRGLGADLGWFWYYWLFTTERVDGSIADARIDGGKARFTVRQDGEMPSPVVVRVDMGPASGNTTATVRGPGGAEASVRVDGNSLVLTWPVDIWFGGSRSLDFDLDFGDRAIERIVWDPGCRFPDRNVNDNVWPRVEGDPGVCPSQRGGRRR